MPSRYEPLITGSIYHVFNKTIEKKNIFVNGEYGNFFLKLFNYYKSQKASMSYSRLKEIEPDIRERILKSTKKRHTFRVEIYSYCLMPTHFHLLLKQKKENGISKFISDIVNSFTKSYNLINDRLGPLFLPQFKSVKIKSAEQFNHVTRYIHLNPYSDGLISKIEDLLTYPWSSFREYMKLKKGEFVDQEFLLRIFNRNRQRYKKFVFDNADYQKNLEKIKYVEKFT